VAATALSLIVLAVLCPTLDLAIRDQVETGVFDDTEQAAGQWSAAARTGSVPATIPAQTDVDLIQLVDSHGRVLKASRAALGRPPLTRIRPPAYDRLQNLTVCSSRFTCVMLMAIRVSPAPDSPVVYAGMAEPPILATNGLEFGLTAVAIPITMLAAWLTWWMVGRTLRPVEAIRRQMSEITGRDLSLRVPQPPGRDEIALLADTANLTLARLQGAVEQQRQFASDTSHELRTPIAGLRMQLEEALLYPGDVDPRDTIRSALSTADRLEAIVSDLLLLARLRTADPAPPEPIDLGALVAEETASRIKGMQVKVGEVQGVRVLGSRMQLIRVLDNLLDNARRHAENTVEVTVALENGKAVVTVTDDGAGIAPHDRDRVFERFTRLNDGRRRDPGGTGLGLAISRDIARLHKGTLRVEDSPRGARFVLRLPAQDAEQSASSRRTTP
jgi:signal transduction histidine kinase